MEQSAFLKCLLSENGRTNTRWHRLIEVSVKNLFPRAFPLKIHITLIRLHDIALNVLSLRFILFHVLSLHVLSPHVLSLHSYFIICFGKPLACAKFTLNVVWFECQWLLKVVKISFKVKCGISLGKQGPSSSENLFRPSTRNECFDSGLVGLC